MKKIGTVARQEGVSVRTIIRLEKAGAFHVKRDRNRTRVFEEEDIRRLHAFLYPEAVGADRDPSRWVKHLEANLRETAPKETP
jgi:hypothetical protein